MVTEAQRRKRAKNSRNYRLRNKKKVAEILRKSRLKHRDRIREYFIIRRYGITEKDYQDILKSQDGVCIICGKINYGQRRLEVDHNHITGKVRGLLCSRCNKVLGVVHEEPTLLIRMANYLTYHKGDPN